MLFILLIILHLYFPALYYNDIDISPDFFLLSLIVLSISFSNYKIILAGILIGFINDLLISTNYFGFITIIYALFAYLLLRLNIYKTNDIFNLFIIISFYFCTISIYLLRYSDSYFFYVKYSLIKLAVSFMVLFMIDKIFGVVKNNAKR